MFRADPIPVLAHVAAGTPLDPNPANDQSSFVISATAFAGAPISYTITLTSPLPVKSAGLRAGAFLCSFRHRSAS